LDDSQQQEDMIQWCLSSIAMRDLWIFFYQSTIFSLQTKQSII
jgi:hypothetical protein